MNDLLLQVHFDLRMNPVYESMFFPSYVDSIHTLYEVYYIAILYNANQKYRL